MGGNRRLRDPELEQALVSIASCLIRLCENSHNYSKKLAEDIIKVNDAIARLQARELK